MIALYARVSTLEQTKGYSIDEQTDRMRKYCEAIGKKDVSVYIDAGFSGSNMERPDLQRMIQDVKEGKIEKVIVYKLDRLSRSQKDTLYLIEDVFLKNGVNFESMSERFDTGTAFGMAMVGILAVFAQLEREQIKERMTIGREGRAKSGKYHGGWLSPVGYEYQEGELIVNDFEAMQIKEIFSLYLQGKSIYQITQEMRAKGYKHKYGEWIDRRVRGVLGNPLYTGKVVFGGKIYDGNHQALISEADFETAAELIKKKHKGSTYNAKPVHLLVGMIYCKKCGALYGHFTTKNQWGKYYNYYCCYSRKKPKASMVKDPNCKAKHYPVNELDTLILNEVSKLALDPDYMESLTEQTEQKEEFEKFEIIRKEIDKLSSQRSRLIDLYGVGGIPVEELSAKIKATNEQMEALFRELDGLTQDGRIDIQEAKDMVKNFSDLVKRGDVAELRNVLQCLIERIELGDDEITIKWRFT